VSKHTPGPWFAEKYGLIQGGSLREFARGKAVEQLGAAMGTHYISDEERQANAVLMAAAPELVEALQAFKQWEWENRADWQGFCVYRRTLGCRGTDGHVSALGTPTPKPHGEQCPFNRLDAALRKAGVL
jgi:hypothetical protein